MVKSVAIACQGGGSHTAFTAGVLKRLLKEDGQKFEIVALSGTSGGAINALLVWYGLLKGGKDKEKGKKEAIKLLDDFWNDNSANTPIEGFLNELVVLPSNLKKYAAFFPLLKMSLFCYSPGLEISPCCNFISEWGQQQLKGILENHVTFGEIKSILKKNKKSNQSYPELLVSAVDVNEGIFRVFKNEEIDINVILASTAMPVLFEGVKINGNTYWDGLFSQNPPVRDFVDEVNTKPEEIWVIHINPRERDRKKPPESITDIRDRRNELAGNLSLYQELYFIHKVNKWIRDKTITSSKYKPIEVRCIDLDCELDFETKLDRHPKFIRGMMKHGEERAEDFLKRMPSGRNCYPFEKLRNIVKRKEKSHVKG